MKQSAPLELVDAGTLHRPGPLGRLVRLLLGTACLYALYQLIIYQTNIVQSPISILPNIVLMLMPAVLIVNYVVNIGFGKSWGRWPVYVSITVFAVLAGFAWGLYGTADHELPGWFLWLWLSYFYIHLGVSFVLSAMLATPGCEMRAIPELIGWASGRAVNEHHCPAGFISALDRWERIRRTNKTE